ncbi:MULTISPECIES: tetratricopeptide repeat protein [Thiorhodovibrio]|uniref:tetratricopeptide repeat protein n=1 Tax=Thiorhodovibrio TaxID=61593 RepID=UPI0019135A96|nr:MULTISPECIES: tetratricopeptide repeat protein [Thiorhodovibrio]MBK5969395.1 cytochrome C [Thiorhodovibrio winogradskyi]WPL14911.1 putative PEP-CTERM system TPR-repeat lipoprotein [Thiorhodovibrio litoralis]
MPDFPSAGRCPAATPLPILSDARSLAPVVPHLLAAALALLLLPAVPALAAGSADAAHEAAADGYIGSARCGTCHATELTAWQGSHHDLAMAEATPENILGDFDDAKFTAHGVTTRFYRDGDAFRVDTDGPDGKPASYSIAYTFGWTPLQQYLIRFPGGRLQALGIAWDSRPADQGGQRWFHLYPDEADYGPDNPLHWTNRDQTWNYQCAECHSTDLHKGYDLSKDAYTTTWAEIDVACEACHGPGAAHAKQAEAAAAGNAEAWDVHKGLAPDLADRDNPIWPQDPETGLPHREPARSSHAEVNTCARCHARRGQLHVPYTPDAPLEDTHRLALLTEGLYYADGQIQDEVFVHGSYIQSRMFHQGVTCSDCHDPHSLQQRAPGNAVCARCHAPARYDSAEHHHHPMTETETAGAKGSGTACVDCHMPERNYMVIDARADHSLRIPRPDLAATLGTPDACTGCHTELTPAQAAEQVKTWYGTPKRPAHFATALHAGHSGAPDAAAKLAKLAADSEAPAIARATALDLLAQQPQPIDPALLEGIAKSNSPLLRAAVARALERLPPQNALSIGLELLDDPTRVVRIDTARAMAAYARLEANVPGRESPLRKALAPALAEYREAQLTNAERPEDWLNLGVLDSLLGDSDAAERDYRQALALEADFTPAYANLADLYRALGRDDDGRTVLEQGLKQDPDDADLLHALGLLEIRTKHLPAAVELLGRAAAQAPEQPRYAYVHALAQEANGDPRAAIATLTAATDRHPNNAEIALALVSLNAKAGYRDAAITWAERYLAHFPDPSGQVSTLLAQLRGTAD